MKRALIVLAAVVLAVAAGLVAYGLYKKHEGRDVRGSSSVEFVTTQAKPPPKLPPKVLWPTYRYDAARNGAPQGIPARIRPPFGVRWYFRGRALVEFPPTIAYGRLYFANANGKLYARRHEAARRGLAALDAALHRRDAGDRTTTSSS